MSERARKLLDEALALSPVERDEFVDLLLKATDRADDDALELGPEWEAEVGRRVAEIESGHAKPIPWSEVRAELQKRQNGEQAN